MDKQTLWLDIYKDCNIRNEIFEKYFSPNGSGNTDWIAYIKDKDDIVIRYEIHVYLDGKTVTDVDTFKADVHPNGDRPRITEKELTAAERKQTKEILSDCLQFPEDNQLFNVIDNATDTQWNGYRITGQTDGSVLYSDPEGKRKRIKKEIILQAFHYSHLHLEMLRDAEVVSEFCTFLGMRVYEPVFAVLRTVDPSQYPNYRELEKQYYCSKLLQAISQENMDQCKKYSDILASTDIDPNPFLQAAIKNKNRELCSWVVETSENNSSSLSESLYGAMQCFPEITEMLLVTGRCKPDSQCMALALNEKNSEFIYELLEYGFEIYSQIGSKYYASLSLDEVKKLLSYNVKLDGETLERIWREDRKDILQLVEENPEKYTVPARLLDLYICHDMFPQFKTALSKGLQGDKETFRKACQRNVIWASELVKAGYDVNEGNGQPLFDASEALNADVVQFLIQNGADVNLKPDNYMCLYDTALLSLKYNDSAKQEKAEKICKMFLKAGLDPIKESHSEPSVISRMFALSTDFKHYLIDWLAERNELNQLDMTEKVGQRYNPHVPFYYTLTWRGIDIDAARYMLKQGAKVDVKSFYNDCLFVRACENGNLEYVQLLTENGADLEEKDGCGFTGISRAVERNNTEVCRYLISHGANINAVVATKQYNINLKNPPISYRSVLDIAVEKESVDCIKPLKEAGAKTAKEILQSSVN